MSEQVWAPKISERASFSTQIFEQAERVSSNISLGLSTTIPLAETEQRFERASEFQHPNFRARFRSVSALHYIFTCSVSSRTIVLNKMIWSSTYTNHILSLPKILHMRHISWWIREEYNQNRCSIFEKLQCTVQFLLLESRECQWHNMSWTMFDLNTIGDFDDGSFCSFSIYGRGSSSIQAGKKTPEKCHPPTTKSIICGIPSNSTKTQAYMLFQSNFILIYLHSLGLNAFLSWTKEVIPMYLLPFQKSL